MDMDQPQADWDGRIYLAGWLAAQPLCLYCARCCFVCVFARLTD